MKPAQDLSERFDLYSREGAPLGRSKPRGEVHRDGDWHKSLHLWVWGNVDGAPHLVFQRRSAAKDTSPGLLDVAVTGHARAGESLADTLREAEEEIGLAVTLEDLVRLGVRRRAVERPGLRDNELQDVYVRRLPADLGALRADAAEVSALLALSLDDAAGVLRDGARADAVRLLPGGGRAREVVAREDFVPAPDRYYTRALASVVAIIGGLALEPWEIG